MRSSSPGNNAAGLINAVGDALAEAFHELYRADTGGAAPPWLELDEAGREANRASVRAVPGQLAAMGLTVAAATTSTEPLAQLPGGAIETAAAKEHERWIDHKLAEGWVYGPTRDKNANPPTHPDLVPWADLDESAQNKDRTRIARLPELLGAVGLVVVALYD